MAIEPQSLEEAGVSYSNASDKLTEASFLFFEKIAFYSAGIISLSITFLGYVISKPGAILLNKSMGLPLYAWIFIAWFLLFISLILSLYIRVFSAEHMSRQMHGKWVEFRIEDAKKVLHTIEVGEGTVNGLSPEKLPEWIANGYKNLEGYKEISNKSSKRIKIYNFISNYIRKVTLSFFLFGCILTLFFVANIVLKISKF